MASESEPTASPERTLRFELAIVSLVMLAYIFTASRVGENLQTAIALLLFFSLASSTITVRSLCVWPAVACCLMLGIWDRPLDVPNHHWMMTYLSSGIALVTLYHRTHEARLRDLRSLARWLMIVLMAFATVQKVASPSFVDGSYIGFEMARGGFAAPVLKMLPSTRDTIEANATLVEQLHETAPDALQSVTLQPPVSPFKPIVYFVTISILVMEGWLCVSMWLLPRWWLTHMSYVLFVVSLATFRQEFTFISVVCALGLMACDEQQPRFRLAYAGLALATAAAVLKTLNV